MTQYTQGSGATVDFSLDSQNEYTQESGSTVDFSLPEQGLATPPTQTVSHNAGQATKTKTAVSPGAQTVEHTAGQGIEVSSVFSPPTQTVEHNADIESVTLTNILSVETETVEHNAGQGTINFDHILVEFVDDNVSDFTYNASKESQDLVNPDGQQRLIPVMRILNQSEKTYDVRFKFDSSLDSCVKVGWSKGSHESSSFSNLTEATTSFKSMVELDPGEEEFFWFYADFDGCSFGDTLNTDWTIEGTVV